MHTGAEDPANEAEGLAVLQAGGVDDLDVLRVLRDISPVGIYRTDQDARCTFVNARWCELTGLTPEQAMGDGWLRAIHPADRERVGREWEEGHKVSQVFKSEYRYLRPDLTVVWIFGQTVALRRADGALLGYMGSATDVTELHLMREKLRRSAEQLEATVSERTQKLFQMALAVESIGDAVITNDFERRIVSWNKAAEVMFGWTAAEMIGETTERLTPKGLLAESASIKDRVRRGERVDGFETMRKTRSGSIIEVSLSIFPLRDARSRIIGTCAVVRDQTQIKVAERRLRKLAWRLLQVQDEERRRLARELHDSTAQTVVAVSLNLAQLIQAGPLMDEARRGELLADSLELAESAMRDLRTTSYLLHPPLLDERGLRSALEWFAEGFRVRSMIEVAVEVDPGVEQMSEVLKLAVFRIVQECLSNVHRHARTKTASLTLRSDGAAWVLTIRDGGSGFAVPVEIEEGTGISGMRERLAQFGGTLELFPEQNGTTVMARIPLEL
jgi:PAS domain S-box-containing protein